MKPSFQVQRVSVFRVRPSELSELSTFVPNVTMCLAGRAKALKGLPIRVDDGNGVHCGHSHRRQQFSAGATTQNDRSWQPWCYGRLDVLVDALMPLTVLKHVDVSCRAYKTVSAPFECHQVRSAPQLRRNSAQPPLVEVPPSDVVELRSGGRTRRPWGRWCRSKGP